MNLPDFILNSSFNSLRQQLGAPLSLYKVRIQLPKPVPKMRTLVDSKPILPAMGLDIQGLSELQVNPDGTLGYEGRRITVHIRDVQSIRGQHHTPRFHVANCRTLEEMRSKGKAERYVISDRDDDVFHIRVDSGPLRQTSLKVCQHCLDKLSWEGFSLENSGQKRYGIVDRFNLKNFFEKYPRVLISQLPTHTVHSAPINDYPENWDEISAELRRQLRYTCQECGVSVGEKHKRFLHIHHLNSLKYDVSVDNLRCLCIRCHASQPDHGHMRALPDLQLFNSIFGN